MLTPHLNNYGYGLLISHVHADEIASMIRNPFFETTEKKNKNLKLVWHWGSNPEYNTLLLKVSEKQISLIILENLNQLDGKPTTLIPYLAEK